jgi:predicted Fe-Mo cluster-binding NifX family protein
MRIAISAGENRGLDSQVSHHFGRCPFFVIVDVDDKEVTSIEVVQNPFYAGHQPGMVPQFIHEQRATVMISGGMGRRAIGFFEEFGIKASTGASGTVRETLNRYLDGGMTIAEPCRESVEHERRGHHHHHHHD